MSGEMVVSIVFGIFLGIGLALHITISCIQKALMIGKYADEIDDYSKDEIQIISASVKEIP